jgi:hypothetical protein
MNSFECLEDEACKNGIEVIPREFKSKNIKGLYCDGTVGINKAINTFTEKACVLAEELGHHHTSMGDILDMSDSGNRKQERQARLWGYNKLIGLRGIIRAYEAGCQNCHEIAEFLDVTEEFLQDCIETYRDKYGLGAEIDGYYVMFIPHLTVWKLV